MCLAVPMKVAGKIGPGLARVEYGGVSTEVSRQLVGEVAVGDYVLVHAGFAIQVLDIEAAEETLKLLGEMAEAVEDEGRGASP